MEYIGITDTEKWENYKKLKNTIHIKEWGKILDDDQTMKEQRGKIYKYVASCTWYGDWAVGGNRISEAKKNLIKRIFKYKTQDFPNNIIL